MIISISIGFGIQNEIKTKFSNIFGDLSIESYENNLFNSEKYIYENKIEIDSLKKIKKLKSINKVIYSPAVVSIGNSFQEVVLKGVTNKNYFYKTKYLLNEVDELTINEILISSKLSKKLNVELGEKILILYYDTKSKPKIRNLTVVGQFDTGISEFDNKIIISNIEQLRSLKRITNSEVGSYELYFDNISENEFSKLEKYIPPEYAINYNKEKFSEIYNWISLFDLNIYLIIVLMIVIGSINMVTALLITILEKTNFIGFLKILGSKNKSIKKIFLTNGMNLIFTGLIWGNIFAILIIILQKYFKVLKLNSETYYIDYIPVDLNFTKIILLNISLVVICFIFLILPLKIISKIKPYSSMRLN